MQEHWVRVAHIDDLHAEGSGFAATADGIDLALFRWNDQIYAIENLCPHMGFPLSEGIMQYGEVICGWHGWHVRLEDGTCRRERDRARVYACEIRGKDVWVKV